MVSPYFDYPGDARHSRRPQQKHQSRGSAGDPFDPFASDLFGGGGHHKGGGDPFAAAMSHFDSMFHDLDAQFANDLGFQDPSTRGHPGAGGHNNHGMGGGGGGGHGTSFSAQRMTARHTSRSGEVKLAHQERKTMVINQGAGGGKFFMTSERKVRKDPHTIYGGTETDFLF
jgi:hypothetical protein